ncbi:MAG: undecaprenyl-diphosphate phosphatase [Anaerolineae bacterium]
MSLFQALFLGILQGATEFLPISSSGHLVLVPWLLGWEAPGLAFDAVVHWGTAAAVVVYFWDRWVSLIREVIIFLRRTVSREAEAGAERDQGASTTWRVPLAWLIVLGTLPGAIAGYLFEDFFEGMFGRPVAAALFLLVTAAILAASERFGRRRRNLDQLAWVDALFVGVGQALAILPGISRSGATVAAGLARGLKREPAAVFSFLLATPIIVGAGLLKVVELSRVGGLAAQGPALLAGFAAAAIVGFVCIHYLIRYLRSGSLYPFAVYCVVFGIICVLVAIAR